MGRAHVRPLPDVTEPQRVGRRTEVERAAEEDAVDGPVERPAVAADGREREQRTCPSAAPRASAAVEPPFGRGDAAQVLAAPRRSCGRAGPAAREGRRRSRASARPFVAVQPAQSGCTIRSRVLPVAGGARVTDSKAMRTRQLSVVAAVICAVVDLLRVRPEPPRRRTRSAERVAPTTATPPPTTVANLPVVTCPTTTLGTQTDPGRGHPRTRPVTTADRGSRTARVVLLERPRHRPRAASVGSARRASSDDGSVSMFVVPRGHGQLDESGPRLPRVCSSNIDNTRPRRSARRSSCGYFPNSAASRGSVSCAIARRRERRSKPLEHRCRELQARTDERCSPSTRTRVTRRAKRRRREGSRCDAGTLCTSILRDALTRLRHAYASRR